MVLVTVAFILVSMAAAFRAKPPKPQIPRIPTASLFTYSLLLKKSTAAEKSSVLISGPATFLGVPLLSPVNEGSNASAANPRSARA
jgi:hypothetical protein